MQFKMLLLPIVLLQLVAVAFTFQMPELNNGGKVWAVLVAGSNGYWNYRHQADVCHAYQILHSHGIPDSQIIVMMYDDIAFDEENPTQGVIINRPNGTDVYHNVPKDYVGESVTPQTFLNVLLGNQEGVKGLGSGKVLQSGPNDFVFVNFADHGGPGILAFPDDELAVTDLQKTIKQMHDKNLYGKLVFYVEACESGSMFEDVLPTDINVYALTASNSEESSYGCYCDEPEYDTCLGDLFSVNWMEDSDAETLSQETIHEQYLIVKNETYKSHVMQYGDLAIAQLTVGQFQGSTGGANRTHQQKTERKAVPAPDIPLKILQKKLKKATNSKDTVEIQRKIKQFHQNRNFMDKVVHNILENSAFNANQLFQAKTQRLELSNLKCYEKTAKYFSKNCFALSKNDYALRQLYMFVNLCEMGVSASTMIAAMDNVCTHPSMVGIH